MDTLIGRSVSVYRYVRGRNVLSGIGIIEAVVRIYPPLAVVEVNFGNGAETRVIDIANIDE